MRQQRQIDFPYLRHGILAGSLGAFVVACFFLIVDIAAGRPLATPTALGAALFLGEPFDLSRPPDATLIASYTAVHGVAFVGFASIAATLVLGARRPPKSAARRGILLAGAFFLVTTGFFYGLGALLGTPDLGAWRVLLANLLASVAMAVPLARLCPWTGPPDEVAREPGVLVGANGPKPPTPSV